MFLKIPAVSTQCVFMFLIIEPTKCTNFSKFYFGIKLNMFRTVSLSIIRSFSLYTQQWYMSYRLCCQLVSRSKCSCSQAVSKPVWHTPLLCVQWKTPDDGQRNCPKHIEFHSKIKFGEISASSWFCYKKRITMRGHMYVKLYLCLSYIWKNRVHYLSV